MINDCVSSDWKCLEILISWPFFSRLGRQLSVGYARGSGSLGSSGGAPFCYALTLHKINIFSGITQLERPGAGRRSSILTRVSGWFLGRVPHLSKSAL